MFMYDEWYGWSLDAATTYFLSEASEEFNLSYIHRNCTIQHLSLFSLIGGDEGVFAADYAVYVATRTAEQLTRTAEQQPERLYCQ